MKKIFLPAAILLFFMGGCDTKKENNSAGNSRSFENFEQVFLDAYWKQHPSGSIYAGYGKYYDILIIPGAASVASDISFARNWIDSLTGLDYNSLNDNNKISYNIIKNQLEGDIWYNDVFKDYEWDASLYNVSNECDYIINQPYAPLDERLKILSKYLQRSDEYYKAALQMLHEPTKEHIELAIQQNQGGVSVFGSSLTDSIKVSQLPAADKTTLEGNIAKTIKAMSSFADSLKAIVANKKYTFRNFSIGEKLFREKFKYDLATDLTPEDIYKKAIADKIAFSNKMILLAKTLWPKYYPGQKEPADSFQLIQLVLDKIQLQHAATKDFFDSLTSQVYQLKKFIVEKKLFDFDTTLTPIKVRIMPEYARGFSVANAEFTPPYQKAGTTYYNIDDLTQYPPEKAESVLREYNNYASQLLSIHEAVPGHCMQGIYNNKKSADVLRSVFPNGAMVEGWAVYTEEMMLENGWGNNSPEMELIHHKHWLRKVGNVIIDYDIHCLNKPKEAIMHLLVNECFQTIAQADEKYRRATLSQVQLCSYFTGVIAIMELREAYKKKMGDKYSLKEFHERFLSFGSSPIKYIRERMLQ